MPTGEPKARNGGGGSALTAAAIDRYPGSVSAERPAGADAQVHSIQPLYPTSSTNSPNAIRYHANAVKSCDAT
ncbi:hypothetical protein Y039_1037 [Burkholderia pseudomallei MSHR1029]|nr:hypothetical protein Y039_1037 [Burkholderia pseudomallei MSHR1029]